MKKADIAMIILVASVAVMVAFFVASSIPFLNADAKGVSVKTIEKIEADVVDPDPDVFNKEAINPTVQAVIGDK